MNEKLLTMKKGSENVSLIKIKLNKVSLFINQISIGGKRKKKH